MSEGYEALQGGCPQLIRPSGITTAERTARYSAYSMEQLVAQAVSLDEQVERLQSDIARKDEEFRVYKGNATFAAFGVVAVLAYYFIKRK